MSDRLPGLRKIWHPSRKVLLFAGFYSMWGIALWVLAKVYNLTKFGVGEPLAIVIVSAFIPIGFIILVASIFVGSVIEWAIRKRRSVFKYEPRPGSMKEKFLRFWGCRKHEPGKEEAPNTNPDAIVSPRLPELIMPREFPAGTTLQDLEDWLVCINGRPSYGKKSPYPDVQRYRAIRDWKLMQVNGTSITLSQFLEERFGTVNKTGLQRVPNSTFYGWWPDFAKDLERFMEERRKSKK